MMDAELLAFEETHPRSGQRKESEMRRAGIKPIRYQQRLIALLEKPETEREHPMLVKRLRRLADQNSAARAARSF